MLAEIDTPDLDQQLMQARAALSVAQANAKLAQITAERWQSLAGTDAVAKQDVDQRTFTWNANVAQVKAAQANVDQLVAEEGFKRLIAPFDGIVTARETDIGALINVGAAGGAELFVVSETSKLRVYVNVPQNYVPSVPSGTKATIQVPEHPGKTYNGTVEASAQAVTPTTGTTLMQIIVDNAAGEMMPGDYASIHLQIAGGANVLSVPSSALIFDAKGLSIATVGADDRVLLKPVSIAARPRRRGRIGLRIGARRSSDTKPARWHRQRRSGAHRRAPRRALRPTPSRVPDVKRVDFTRCTGAALTLVLGACSFAPPLKTPQVPTADAYKELGPWTQAQPADRLPRDSWWTLYENTELDGLEKRLIDGNPTLAAALANYAQAKASAIRRAQGCFPRWDSTAASSVRGNRSTPRSSPG